MCLAISAELVGLDRHALEELARRLNAGRQRPRRATGIMSGVSIAVVAVAVVLLVLLFRSGPGSASPRIDWSNATDADLHGLLDAGRKIEAIKLYRQLHGVGLKEAKEAVERIARDQPLSGSD
jgi:hypothetical protein